MIAAIPADETTRIATLRGYEILDTEPETAFDDLTLLASQICQTPFALISLVDTDRQWFKSKIGITQTETPRDVAFCSWAILERDVFVGREKEEAARGERDPDGEKEGEDGSWRDHKVRLTREPSKRKGPRRRLRRQRGPFLRLTD